MRLQVLIFIGLCGLPFLSHAQSFYSGIIPELTISHELTKSINLTGKVESMHEMYDGADRNGSEWQHSHQRTDFQIFLSTPLNPYWSIAGGYQLRWLQDGHFVHRSIQQITFVQRKYGYRLGHRLRTDQTYFSDAKTEYRIRYRLSGELPLSGATIDPGEYYIIFSDEPIYSIQNGQSGWENRLVGSLGFYFNRKHKLEAGLDHRFDRFIRDRGRQRLWMKLSWYVNL